MKAVSWPLGVMLLAWLLVVASVGGVTYLVVDRASRGVGQAPAASAVAALPAAEESAPTPSSSPTRTRTSTPTPTRTRTTAPAPAPTRTAAPTRTPAPTRTSPTTSAPAPTRARTTPTTTKASFATRGGTVVASCTSGKVRLESITVRDGWRFETDTEDGHLEVHFKGGEDEVELTIGCVGGVPTRLGD